MLVKRLREGACGGPSRGRAARDHRGEPDPSCLRQVGERETWCTKRNREEDKCRNPYRTQ
jgi:hypothetical protein